MSRWGIRNTALLAAALLALAFALSSCGGSGSDTSSSSTQAPGEAESRSGAGGDSGTGGKVAETGGNKQGESSGQGGKSSGQGGGKSKKASKATPVAPLHGSGGGSGQNRVKGGDNSVQEFGEESGESELEEAATALHTFLVARVRQEWPRACANLSSTMIENLKRLVENEENENISCPAAFAKIAPTLPPKVAHGSTVVNADSLRVKGRHGFLIYHGFEGVLYAISMAHEGRWKVAALAGVPLR
ncbi:MAG: hypothetical protein ACM3N0_00745 [Chloroflexota bacterium]